MVLGRGVKSHAGPGNSSDISAELLWSGRWDHGFHLLAQGRPRSPRLYKNSPSSSMTTLCLLPGHLEQLQEVDSGPKGS